MDVKRTPISRKEIKRRVRVKRMIQRFRRENTYTLIGHRGQVLRGRIVVREGSLILLRVVK